MIRHMSLNIEGFLRNNGKKKIDGFFTDDDGKELTDKDGRIFLQQCLHKGWKKIPLGECDGFDHFDKGCPGHKSENQ